MKTVVRLAGPGDLDLLAHVAGEPFDDPLDLAATRRFLSDPNHMLVIALRGEAIVGFISSVIYLHPDKPAPECWINEVGVSAAARREGIASRMLAATLDHARVLGCGEAWVLTERSNPAAMRLYASLGGEEGPPDIAMFSYDLRGPSSHNAQKSGD